MHINSSSNSITKFLTVVWLFLLAGQLSANFAGVEANHTSTTFAESYAEPVPNEFKTDFLSVPSNSDQTDLPSICLCESKSGKINHRLFYTESVESNPDVDLISPFTWIISHQYFRSSLSNIFNH